jgi:FAD synthase
VRLRDEEHFESAESLVAQLEKDKEITRNVFKEIEKKK